MDTMQIEILDDGVVKVQTSAVSKKNHMSADQLLDMVEDLCGGERTTEKLKPVKQHLHQHQHKHAKA